LSNKKEDIVKYRIERCLETVGEAQTAINEEHYFLAANRIYYAIFYIVNALAIKDGFRTSKHYQLLGWFNKNYVKSGIVENKFGKIYRNAFETRMESDYDDFVQFTAEEINTNFTEMKSFVEEIKRLIEGK